MLPTLPPQAGGTGFLLLKDKHVSLSLLSFNRQTSNWALAMPGEGAREVTIAVDGVFSAPGIVSFNPQIPLLLFHSADEETEAT